jgi:hypothetical protein
MKKTLGIFKCLMLALLGFFAVTFAIYYFALDSKLLRKLMPVLTRWYDAQDKKRERPL